MRMAMGIVASVKLPFDVSEMPRRRPDPLTDLRARRVRVRRAPARPSWPQPGSWRTSHTALVNRRW